MTGIVINQPDLPHWATGILNWLAMVQQINQATGEIGRTYRGLLKRAIEVGEPSLFIGEKRGSDGRVLSTTTVLTGPASVYGVFQSFCLAVEAEASKS